MDRVHADTMPILLRTPLGVYTSDGAVDPALVLAASLRPFFIDFCNEPSLALLEGRMCVVGSAEVEAMKKLEPGLREEPSGASGKKPYIAGRQTDVAKRRENKLWKSRFENEAKRQSYYPAKQPSDMFSGIAPALAGQFRGLFELDPPL